MNIERERAAFEWWASDEGESPRATERVGGCYKLAQIQSYWMAWQARAALQAECEKLRKDAKRYVPLNEAVQRAAAELPEGWEIQLCAMRDSGWVDLIGPDGTEDFDTNNERLDYTVIDALEFAVAAAMEEARP